jgi:hypothetical protein
VAAAKNTKDQPIICLFTIGCVNMITPEDLELCAGIVIAVSAHLDIVGTTSHRNRA